MLLSVADGGCKALARRTSIVDIRWFGAAMVRQVLGADRSTQTVRPVLESTNTIWGSAWAVARGTVYRIGDGDNRCRRMT